MPSRPGSRVMNSCPYNDCSGSSLARSSLGTKLRRADHMLMRCPLCESFSVRTPNGFVFPLNNATDPNADVVIATR